QVTVLGDVAGDTRKKIDALKLLSRIFMGWVGEVTAREKAFFELLALLLVGVARVYLVIAARFEDVGDSFSIMFFVTFRFVGVIWAFVLTGTALNVITFIGIIMLMGIVVKNAIVFVDYTRQLISRGMDLHDAIITGGKTRLRPVLMTSLTTIFGMIPLALSRGEGSEIWNALGITVIGGLLVSGLVTLVLVPIVYYIVHKPRFKANVKKINSEQNV
ncbi:MAG: efflux RND transporter permease subunit, partial [Desulfobacteraceae bacterium]|nr:efflux RND transporter permease subunit [Desulfobacteraceae bacterium]